jgi:colicin import membrane protein
MIRKNWRMALLVAASGGLVALSGCSAGHANTRVKDEWMARVPESELGEVREAQTHRLQANDAIVRAEVEIRDAERALEVVRREEGAARMRKEAEQVSVKAAEAKGQRDQIDEAKSTLKGAEGMHEAAKAQVAWREHVVEMKKGQKELREREAEVANAELALAEYQALKNSGDVRADQLSEADFNKSVSEARSRLASTQKKVEKSRKQEGEARAQWENLRDRAEGYGGSGRD